MKRRLFIISIFIIYTIIMTAGMIWQGIGIAPDRYIVVLLLATFLFTRKTRDFLVDWIPFLLLILLFDYLRGWADNSGQQVHVKELISVELTLFGELPTRTLQRWLFNGTPHWYDYIATILYFLHFALPFNFGYIMWIYRREYFKQFVTGILLLSYAALLTFVLYPAAPPWYAQNEGYFSGITKIMDQTIQAFPEKLSVPTVYHKFNTNPVAALPSLHAAYPFIIFLFALSFFKKKGWFFFPYVLAMWVSIVYLGEHYVIDVILGAVYALIAFLLTRKVFHNPSWHKWVAARFGFIFN